MFDDDFRFFRGFFTALLLALVLWIVLFWIAGSAFANSDIPPVRYDYIPIPLPLVLRYDSVRDYCGSPWAEA
ncbi:MAG: hypothetical protein WD512_12660, partial [Candidatus Paceibacterota bacterium]